MLIILYNIDFFVGYYVPKSVNTGSFADPGQAVIINCLLLTIFSLQHSIMARPGFKKWFATILPSEINRSTYILISSILLAAVFWLWKPIPTVVFDLRGSFPGTVLWILYGLGWMIGIISTFQINHFELFGLSQAIDYLKGKQSRSDHFVTPFFYQIVRHPIYLGWLMIHWITPYMTIGRMLFASFISVYIFIAIYFEERDLIDEFGEKYKAYRRSTPKVFPVLIKRNND
jgi:protein-S-isoprenylcysteine O-methyltransferase Ste14